MKSIGSPEKTNVRRKLLIIGCGGHSKVITDIAEAIGFQDIHYQDPGIDSDTFLDRQVYKSIKENYKDYFVVAIGDNFIREKVSSQFLLNNKGAENINLIHPSSIFSPRCSIGEGCIVMPLSAINSSSEIGNGVIINTNSSVDHDNQLMNFSSIAPGVSIGGNVSIGERTAICIGASIKHNLKIGKDVVVGASSLVHESIGDNEVVYGVPAKFIRRREVGEKYL